LAEVDTVVGFVTAAMMYQREVVHESEDAEIDKQDGAQTLA
jgi:hypothetical protein